MGEAKLHVRRLEDGSVGQSESDALWFDPETIHFNRVSPVWKPATIVETAELEALRETVLAADYLVGDIDLPGDKPFSDLIDIYLGKRRNLEAAQRSSTPEQSEG